MQATGITGNVALTSLGSLVRSIPNSDFGVIAQHPGVGPDITFDFFDTAVAGSKVGSITVTHSNPVNSIELALGSAKALSYTATIGVDGAMASPGAYFVVYEDMGDAAHRDANLPQRSTDGQTTQFPLPVVAPSVRIRDYSIPRRGAVAVLGTSSVYRATATLANGTVLDTNGGYVNWANAMLGNPWKVSSYGYAGENNATLRARLLDTVLPTKPAAVFLCASNNDIVANDLASAATAYAQAVEMAGLCIAVGVTPIIITPHLQTDVAGKWGPTVAYDTLMQEWGFANGVSVISGCAAAATNADKLGTAKTNAMSDTLHLSGDGALYVAQEIVAVYNGGPCFRASGAGSAEWSGILQANPHMTGTGSTGTGVTGTRAANYTVQRSTGTGTAVASKGSDREGDYMDLAITAASATDSFKIVELIAQAKYLTGKTYRAYADVEILASNAAISEVRYRNPLTPEVPLLYPGYSQTQPLPAGRYTLRSKPFTTDAFTIPANPESGLYVYCAPGAGTGTVRVRTITIRETI